MVFFFLSIPCVCVCVHFQVCSYLPFLLTVHCRRRKIRCLVAADDAQGRCENCIRLRKECHFFPVDQQPPVEKRSRPGSKMENQSTDPSTTSSSPPAMAATSVTDQGEQRFYPYAPMPMNSGQDMSAFNPGAFAGTPVSTFSPGWWHAKSLS